MLRTSKLSEDFPQNYKNFQINNSISNSNPLPNNRAFGRTISNSSASFSFNPKPIIANTNQQYKTNQESPSTSNSLSGNSLNNNSFHDLNQINNPQYVTEYSTEIMFHWKETERSNIANYSSLFIHQKEINERARAILIEWLTDVHSKYNLIPETLYLTINIIDRYLEKKYIDPSSFQLLGISSMLIASKYEEIYSPEIRDFIRLSRGAYTRDQIIQMESRILSLLNFDLIYASSYTFLLKYYLISVEDINNHNIQVFHLAQYIMELSLINVKIMNYPQSIRACAALYMGRKVLCFETPWLASLKTHSGYDENNLKFCIKETVSFLKNILKHNSLSFIEKFKSGNYSRVALIFLGKSPKVEQSSSSSLNANKVKL